jgi:hypothetical protein
MCAGGKKAFLHRFTATWFHLQSTPPIKAMHFFPVDALLLNAGAGHSIWGHGILGFRDFSPVIENGTRGDAQKPPTHAASVMA